MNKGITVRELQLMCVKAMADGHGAIIKRDGHEYRVNISKEEE